MRRILTVLFTLAVLMAGGADAPAVIRTAAGLKDALYEHPAPDRPFDLTARLIHVRKTDQTTVWAVEDESGAVILTESSTNRAICNAVPGDRVALRGRTVLTRYSFVSTHVDASRRIAGGQPPAATDVSARELLAGRFDCRFVRISGSVRDAFETEDNPLWEILVLVCDGQVVTVSLPHGERDRSHYTDLIGATVSITGVVVPADNSPRRQLGRILTAAGPDDIRLVSPAAKTADVPRVDDIRGLRPSEIAALDRHRAVGRVLATWLGDTFLIRTETDKIVRVELADGMLPSVGSRVEAVGFPESDLYRVNLARARVRPLAAPTSANEPPHDLKPGDIVTVRSGRTIFNPQMHGRLVRFEGVVRSLPTGTADAERMQVATGDLTLPVEIGLTPEAAAGLTIGCRVRLTGICVMESENWRPNAVFPRIRGALVVLRSDDGLEILSRPSWFTPVRLLTILGLLTVVLLGILAWNLALRRQSERRARKLTEEAIARAESDFKVEERTRLAVELHDSVAQNLTGVAMELEAARQYERDAPTDLLRHLEIAWNTLRSCRDELRNCLWDLRSRALEETDMNESIRRMLLPSVRGVSLKIRFSVPRTAFSDNTAHTVMRVIRELVVNGIRHGHATEIAIAGALDRGTLCFSVRDNGSGFDPATAPDVTCGHFGLEGIRERIRSLGGTFEIASSPGTGAKATVRIRQLQENPSHG